jgi:hypothetical protein
VRRSPRIDFHTLKEHFDTVMKFLFRHFLLLGVILGLVGQGVAFALPPCATMQQEQASAMAGMSDCAMGQQKPDKAPAPCKDMKPGCFAMVGCAALVGLNAQSPVLNSRLAVSAIYQWSATPVLHGRIVPPDPYPPSLLG